jgi:copper(I)-binding protein
MKVLILAYLILASLTGTAGAASSIRVSEAWSRPAIATGVAYLTITNHSAQPDRLISATSPVANAIELHESTETYGSMSSMNGMAMGSVASMHRVASIPVPAHGTAHIGPGSYHIMLIGLHHDLHANQTFPLHLHFADAGWIATAVRVRPM